MQFRFVPKTLFSILMGKEVFALNTVNIKINPLYDKSKMIPLYCHLVLVEWWQNKKIKCVFFLTSHVLIRKDFHTKKSNLESCEH